MIPDQNVRLECERCLCEADYASAGDWVVNSKGKWICGACENSWRETLEQDREVLGRQGHRRRADLDYHGNGYEE